MRLCVVTDAGDDDAAASPGSIWAWNARGGAWLHERTSACLLGVLRRQQPRRVAGVAAVAARCHAGADEAQLMADVCGALQSRGGALGATRYELLVSA